MVLDYYHFPASAACRAVQMVAKAVGVDLNCKFVDLVSKDQLKPEFIQLNPQHTVPTLVDDGFPIWESRAILIYLIERYGGETTLYPSDPKHRAIVNQRLYFDLGTLYQRFGDYIYPQINQKQPADPEKLKKLEEAFDVLDTFLADSPYVAGEHLTIADIALIATVSTIEISDFDISRFAHVKSWFDRVKSIVPGWELNEAGLADFKKFVDTKNQK